MRFCSPIVLFLLVVLPIRMLAQGFSVHATLDTNMIKIGNQAHITLEVTSSSAYAIKFPSVADTLTEHIEIVHQSNIDTLPSADSTLKILRKTLTITAFDSGYFPIPPFAFYADNDSANIIQTEALLLTVRTIAVDTTKAFRKIKDPINPPWSIAEIKNELIIGFIVIAAIIGVIIWIRKRQKNTPVITPIEPQIPAYLTALEALKSLNEQKLWQSGKAKDYHIALSDIIRTYIGKQYGINAMEMTSEEILKGLRLQLTNHEIKIKLSQILVLSDMVKFAKENPLPNENESSMQYAIAFVEGTINRNEEVGHG